MKRAQKSVEKLTKKLSFDVYTVEQEAKYKKSKENYQKQIEAIKKIMADKA